jgi:hypothetical protein
MAGAEAPGVADDDYFSGEYLQDILESDLLELGGQRLLDEAHDEAGAFVDAHYPWDGRGDEPAGRVSAYCTATWPLG